MKSRLGLLSLILLLSFQAQAFSMFKPKVFFKWPRNGDVVASPFKVKFGEHGMKLKPAGVEVDNKKVGHFHIIIDGEAIPQGVIIPEDSTHIHFGKAQKHADLSLPPGHHTLTLQFGDGLHRSYGPNLSQTIEITVKQ